MIEQSMNLHFYLNLIASNPYLVKLSVSQQQALTKFPPLKGGLGGIGFPPFKGELRGIDCN